MAAAPKDEDGVTLKSGDYITFSFGVPPIGVTARVTENEGSWSIYCIHPADVKPQSAKLSDLTKHYQIYKASRQRVDALMRTFIPTQPGVRHDQ